MGFFRALGLAVAAGLFYLLRPQTRGKL